MARLTIAIPTYNRADKLDRQLSFLEHALDGFDDDVELLVSDNASTDATPDVITRWADQVRPGLRLHRYRNPENVRVMRSIGLCIERASTEYLWLLGDDDELRPDVVERVLSELDTSPPLQMLCLNYSMHDVHTGDVMTERRYRLDGDWTKERPGPLEATDAAGVPLLLGLGFMSAQVYRTETIQAAVATWSDDTNLEIQIFWSGYCAARGRVRFTDDTYVRYICGDNVLAKPRNWYQCQNHDAPLVYTNLLRQGYSKGFSRPLILGPVASTPKRRAFLGGFTRWPTMAVRSLAALTVGMISLAHAPSTTSAPAEMVSIEAERDDADGRAEEQ